MGLNLVAKSDLSTGEPNIASSTYTLLTLFHTRRKQEVHQFGDEFQRVDLRLHCALQSSH